MIIKLKSANFLYQNTVVDTEQYTGIQHCVY
jgi:hypothetical protein